MRNQLKLVVLLSSVVTSTALFAQNTPPAQPPVKPTQIAQGSGAPGAVSSGAQATGAAAEAAGAAAAGGAGMGIPGAIAAGLTAVGAASTNDNGTPAPAATTHH